MIFNRHGLERTYAQHAGNRAALGHRIADGAAVLGVGRIERHRHDQREQDGNDDEQRFFRHGLAVNVERAGTAGPLSGRSGHHAADDAAAPAAERRRMVGVIVAAGMHHQRTASQVG